MVNYMNIAWSMVSTNIYSWHLAKIFKNRQSLQLYPKQGSKLKHKYSETLYFPDYISTVLTDYP